MYKAFSKKGTLFQGGHYSREDIIQGNTVFQEYSTSDFILQSLISWLEKDPNF